MNIYIDFSISYITAIIVGIISLTFSFSFKEVDIRDDFEERITIINHFKKSMKILKDNKKLLNIIMFFPIVYTFSAIVYFYGQQFLNDLGYSRLNISIIFLLNGILSAIGAILSDKIYKKYNASSWLSISMIISFLLILMGNISKELAIFTFLAIGFLTAILQPISSKLINSMVESKQRATIISVESMFYSLMMIILFPVCGLIGDLLSLELSFEIIGIIGVVITTIEILILKKK